MFIMVFVQQLSHYPVFTCLVQQGPVIVFKNYNVLLFSFFNSFIGVIHVYNPRSISAKHAIKRTAFLFFSKLIPQALEVGCFTDYLVWFYKELSTIFVSARMGNLKARRRRDKIVRNSSCSVLFYI